MRIQQKLKAPKGQFNNFGKYKYRSCEDILEAVKPLLAENKCVLTISDEMVGVGDRIYVKAVARLVNSEGKEVTTVAFAREEESKKGMDASQVTGAASSYARKYALNGLFCIDDTKDSDATNVGRDDIDLVLQEINNCTSRAALTKIWNSNNNLQGCKEILNAFKNKGKQFPE